MNLLWVLILVTSSFRGFPVYDVAGPFGTYEICRAAMQTAREIGQNSPGPHGSVENDSVYPVCIYQDEVDAYIIDYTDKYDSCNCPG